MASLKQQKTANDASPASWFANPVTGSALEKVHMKWRLVIEKCNFQRQRVMI